MHVFGVVAKWTGALFLISLLALTGCATVEGVWCAEGFSSRDMREDGLVVGGVVDADGEVDPQTEKVWGTFLREALEEDDDPVRAGDPEELSQALGIERFIGLMDEYRVAGELSPESLHGVAASGVAERYLLLVRLVGSDVEESKGSESDGDEVKYTKESTRTVEVVARVFDLEEGVAVWRAAGNHEMKEEITYDESGVVERVIYEIIGADASVPDYPDAPSVRDVLEPILQRLASELKEA